MGVNEKAYIVMLNEDYYDYCIIAIYNSQTKLKVSEYGIFDNTEEARRFATEHHIEIEDTI